MTEPDQPQQWRGQPMPEGNRPVLLWGGTGTLYEVDMGLHHTSIEMDLPSQGDATMFRAHIAIQWRVADPAQIVRDAVRDVRNTLRPPLEQRLGTITRRYYARAVANAEETALQELVQFDVGAHYGLTTIVFLRLAMNDTSVGQLAQLDGVQHERSKSSVPSRSCENCRRRTTRSYSPHGWAPTATTCSRVMPPSSPFNWRRTRPTSPR